MPKSYFFCGIGGSGMLPLAVLMKSRGATVYGSDRARDQGKTPEKFKALEEFGIELFPQDGSGINDTIEMLVVSSAIEESIPDVRAALGQKIPIIKRGALLAECFNQAEHKIAIAGTSGKSTVTGMVGTMLVGLGQNPTIVNGGEIRNIQSQFSGIRKGRDDLFVAEMDESDGSISHYEPSIALLNNIALDHKSMADLEFLFGAYLARATHAVIVNADQPRVMDLVRKVIPKAQVISYSTDNEKSDVYAKAISYRPNGTSFVLCAGGREYPVDLNVPGPHNIQNALACLCVALVMEIELSVSIHALESFRGIHRRFEVIGTEGGITVIDDFAHNPDKITATLSTLKAFDGRLMVMFQPHGFGPLKHMGREMTDVFQQYLSDDDILLMPEAYYAGGTVDRSVTAKDLIENLKSRGVNAHWFETREQIPAFIKSNAQKGDRIVIMGARDDTLHIFAKDILKLF